MNSDRNANQIWGVKECVGLHRPSWIFSQSFSSDSSMQSTIPSQTSDVAIHLVWSHWKFIQISLSAVIVRLWDCFLVGFRCKWYAPCSGGDDVFFCDDISKWKRKENKFKWMNELMNKLHYRPLFQLFKNFNVPTSIKKQCFYLDQSFKANWVKILDFWQLFF